MLVHPGVAATSLLARRPEQGRSKDTAVSRVLRGLAARGLLVNDADGGALPALYAATSPNATSGRFYGPGGLLHWSGAPAEQRLYRQLRSPDDAQRIWAVSEQLADVRFPSSP